MSQFFKNNPAAGGVCRQCKHDLRTHLKGPGERYVHMGKRLSRGEIDGTVTCSNHLCYFYDHPYLPGKSLNTAGLAPDKSPLHMAMLSSLSKALGPLQAGNEWAN